VFGYATFANSPFAALGATGIVYDVAVDETGTVISSSESANAVFIASQAEAASTSGVFNTLNNIFNNVISEAGSGSSAQTSQVAFAALIAEVASTQAAQTVIATMLASQAEGVTALATPTANSVLLAAILEAASGADANTGSKLIVASISEAASGASVFAASAVFSGTVAEVASAVAAFTVVRQANVYPTGVQLYVYIGGVLVWATIDDSQTPNWQNIDDTQTPGWTILPS
jgi:hypothetical protein